MYDIELGEIIKSEDLIYGVSNCYYTSGDTCTTINPIVSYIRFMDDTLVVGHLKFRYEYILSFQKNHDQLTVVTLTTLDENGDITKSDTLSELILFFEDPFLIELFMKKFINIIRKYKYRNVFDKSILRFKNFIKHMSRFSLS